MTSDRDTARARAVEQYPLTATINAGGKRLAYEHGYLDGTAAANAETTTDTVEDHPGQWHQLFRQATDRADRAAHDLDLARRRLAQIKYLTEESDRAGWDVAGERMVLAASLRTALGGPVDVRFESAVVGPSDMARPTTDDARAEAERRFGTLTPDNHVLQSHQRAAFVVGAQWAATRAETATVHLADPTSGDTYCGEPVTVITEAGDMRPVCQACHRGAMKTARSGWCPCVSGRPQDCSPEKWPLSVRHGKGKTTTATVEGQKP